MSKNIILPEIRTYWPLNENYLTPEQKADIDKFANEVEFKVSLNTQLYKDVFHYRGRWSDHDFEIILVYHADLGQFSFYHINKEFERFILKEWPEWERTFLCFEPF